MRRRLIACGLAFVCSLQYAAPAWAGTRRLPDGTRIAVRTVERLSSATLKDSDPVTFAVLEDVVVDGEVVIKQGTTVRGTIVDAEAKRRMGRAGKLQYAVNETKAVDHSVVRLRAVQERKGDSNVTSTTVTTVAVGVFVPVAAPFFLLRKGHDIVVPEGTRIDTFVDGDHMVSTDADAAAIPAASAALAAAPAPAAAPAAPAARPAMSNADVLALHKAGFGEDVILAKIAASTAAYRTDAGDLVALKKAGVSDRVVGAMIAAK
jgi:hypothetical protein